MYASGSAKDIQDLLSERGQASWRHDSKYRVSKVLPLQHPAVEANETAKENSRGWTLTLPKSRIEWLELFIPCIRWMRSYEWKSYLKQDIMAGITVGAMIVPQAMSYAKLAGLQAVYGLYSSCVPVFAYGIFGSSRQLAVGPVALVSLLVSNVLSQIVDTENTDTDDTEEYYSELAILLAFMVGIIECLMGILRLGWLIRFISHTVISGFTSASAIVIALSQAKYFLGYDVTQSSKIITLLKSIIAGLSEFQWQPFVMGCALLSLLLIMKHLGKTTKQFRFMRAAGPITAVVVGILFVIVVNPSNISLVGSIPQGLPHFSVPKNFSKIPALLGTAFLITGVAILESVGIAKNIAARNGYEIDSNQELFGLGVANFGGSFFCAYPTTGSFSRTAVNNESGATTGLAGLVTGVLLIAALLFLTPIFKHIPECTLASIVISAVIGLVDYNEPVLLWRVDKREFILWLATFINTLFFGIEIGVLIGVGLSLAFVIHESANPHLAILGRLPGTTVYRNVNQYPEAHTYEGIVIVRIDAPIYFANVSYIKERLRKYEIHSASSQNQHIQYVIIELSPVIYVDYSAAQALKELSEEFKTKNIQMALSNPKHEVMLTLSKIGISDSIGKEWLFVRVHDAVQVCRSHIQKHKLESENESKDHTQPFQSDQSSEKLNDEEMPLLGGNLNV